MAKHKGYGEFNLKQRFPLLLALGVGGYFVYKAFFGKQEGLPSAISPPSAIPPNTGPTQAIIPGPVLEKASRTTVASTSALLNNPKAASVLQSINQRNAAMQLIAQDEAEARAKTAALQAEIARQEREKAAQQLYANE